MGRPPCCDKSNVKRGLWTAEEDAKILAYVSKHGVGNWTMVPKKAGLNRCGKSCRLRWTNYLRPDLNHDSFTSQEEELIISLHKAIGSRWSMIAKELPGRTDNDVKNYWNTKLRKKLSKMGIDPVTHKPFSQILSDYGNISSLPTTGNPNGSFNKHLEVPRSEPCLVSSRIMNPMILEQAQENSSTNINPSWNLQLPQFGTTVQPCFLNEATSTASSSSSNTVTQFRSPQSQASPFGYWSEFLLSDPCLPTDFQPQQEVENLQGMLLATKSSPLIQNKNLQCKFTNGAAFVYGGTMGGGETNNCSEASSSANSFVDAILDQDSQMCSEFPQLFDESFDY